MLKETNKKKNVIKFALFRDLTQHSLVILYRFQPMSPAIHALKVNPLNTQLNSICHLLALLRAHHILHVSGIRVKHNQRAVSWLHVSTLWLCHDQKNPILTQAGPLNWPNV